jgi:hypothetical protein
LQEAKNVKVSPEGLEGYESVSDPFGGAISASWPFPQLVRGKHISLLFGDTTLESVTESGTSWTKSPITTYDAANPNVTKAIVSGNEWHFADLMNSFYAFNENCTVFRVGIETLAGLTTKTFVQDSVTIRTGTESRGRVVFGGFSSADFWSSSVWQSIFQDFQATLSGSGINTSFDDIDANWVFWSSIGGGDFPLWLFHPALYSSVATAPTLDRFVEKLKENTFGWMPMPFQGEVKNVKDLNGNVICYGVDGVAALVPIPPTVEDTATYGIQSLATFGVAQRSAVGASPFGHIFIDTTGALWSIAPDLTITRLGYEEYLFPMLSEDIRITWDGNQRDFRICSESYGFLLTPNGLSSHYQRVTSAYHVQGAQIGVYLNDASLHAQEGKVVSNVFDMAHTGIKHIGHVSVDVRSLGDVFVALDYRYDRNSEWRRSAWTLVNLEGNARLSVSGLEFRLAVKTDNHDGFELDQAWIRWLKDDTRHVRGADADPTVTRAG